VDSKEEHAPAGGIEVVEDDPRSVVRLWGEVDASLRGQASDAMVRILQRGGPYVIDVSEVTFIDSSGLAFILQLHRVAADESTHVVLRDPPTLVMDLLDLVGVAGQVPLEFSTGPSASAGTVHDDAPGDAPDDEAAPAALLPILRR